MATTPINRVDEREKSPSALENAAKILGIAVQAGGIANTAAGLMKKPEPSAPDFTMPVKKDPALELNNPFGR